MCHQHTVTNLLLLPEFTITGLKASIPSPGTCLLLAGLLVCQAPAAYRHLLVTSVSYMIYYGMHSVHAILASSKNRDLGTRVWAPGFGCCLRVAWVFLPGASCPPDAPPKNQPDTDAPHGSVHRVVAPNDPLHPDASFPPDAPPKNQPAMCHWDSLLSLSLSTSSTFHYGQGYALSSRHFVRLKGFHGTEECA